MDKIYYLDNAATTPLSDEVKKKIIDVLDDFGNPSSVYDLGTKTRAYMDDARKSVAKFINSPTNSEIIFTSSGSAANSLAIRGLAESTEKYVLLYSPTSHKSMWKCCEHMRYSHELKVNKYGEIDMSDLRHKLEEYREEQILVCFEAANSELGTIQPIKEITDLVHYYNGIVVVDFTGYIPHFKVDVLDFDVDIATFSGHKLHAPKGIGVLYKLEDIHIKPLIYGSQENGYFGGTENILGIVGLGVALDTYEYKKTDKKFRHLYFELLNKLKDVDLLGSNNRLPNNLFLSFKGVDGSQLMSLLALDNIYISTGSACNNYTPEPSKSLVAIGLNPDRYNSCIRITLSGDESEEDLNYVIKKIVEHVNFLREVGD